MVSIAAPGNAMQFRFFVRSTAGLLATLSLAGCISLGEPVGLETAGQITSPPRSDGTIPASFTAFVEGLRPQAEARGVSRATFDAAFEGLGPDPTVLEAASRQAEFVKPIWDYLDGAASSKRVANGRAALSTHQPTLDRIEATYGVPRQVVVAIWGMESSYGEVLGNPKVVRNAVRALATLAWNGGRRASYGRTQLLAVLKILERGTSIRSTSPDPGRAPWGTRSSSRRPTRPMPWTSRATAGGTSGPPSPTRSPPRPTT